MLRSIRERAGRDEGFTLIELCVVIFIIGTLAAVALPAFLGAEHEGADADAKSNARNLVTAVESCFMQTHAYTTCDTRVELEATGARVGSRLTDTTAKEAGAVAVSAAESSYTIVSYSKSGNAFSIAKDGDGPATRSCTIAADGGCHSGNVW